MGRPLVSIIVITYNSSKYVLKTLESASAQTYPNIELIVSDDGSTDNTIEICREWMEQNKGRFVRTELVTTPVNTGIPANCNRGLKASRGVWVKLIAGDDFIAESYVAECLSSGSDDNEVGIIYTNSYIIDAEGKITAEEPSLDYKSGRVFDDIFFLRFWPKTSSMLFLKEALSHVGNFDESNWVEDYLLVLKIAQKYKFLHIDQYLTYYRVHESNISKGSLRLLQSQLQVIKQFDTYPGFRQMEKQLLEQLFMVSSVEKASLFYKLLITRTWLVFTRTGWLSILRQLAFLTGYYKKK
jgi:glycosyltransferase involved in cell wall biosynthesis